MSDRLKELGDNTQVVLITFTDKSNLEWYQQTHDLPIPVLVDPDRITYKAYGLGRGTVARIWGRKAARRYLDIFKEQGLAGLRRPTEDTLQLGGDFVVDPNGTLTYGFWGEGPDDRPDVTELIAAVR